MRTLVHLALCPFSRKIRLALAEKDLPFETAEERVWERRDDFLALNPAGQVPVLIDEDERVVCDSIAIAEYLEEMYPEHPLWPRTAVDRTEARRLALWFDLKFNAEVTVNLLGEKVMKRLARTGTPDSAAIRAGTENIRHHLDYIAWIVDRRNWLAGDQLTYADLAAAAHLSCLDFIGAVPWERAEPAKVWYARIKSRKSFRPLLADGIPGMPPPRHYADLDF